MFAKGRPKLVRGNGGDVRKKFFFIFFETFVFVLGYKYGKIVLLIKF